MQSPHRHRTLRWSLTILAVVAAFAVYRCGVQHAGAAPPNEVRRATPPSVASGPAPTDIVAAPPTKPQFRSSPSATARETLETRALRPIELEDAGRRRAFRLALDELYVRDPAEGKGHAVAVGPASDPAGLFAEMDRVQVGTGLVPELVLYEEGVARDEFTRRVVTREVMLEAPSREQADLAAQVAGLTFRDAPAYAPGKYLYLADSSTAALAAHDLLAGRPNLACTVLLARQQSKRAMPNDPLVGQQWHLKYSGQSGAVSNTDLNVESVWAYPTVGAGRRGRGIRVGIVDDGLQTNHPDLAANVDTVNDRDWNGNDADPSPGTGDDHGTSCAGNAAAVGNNALGVCGSAPEATLVGMRLIADVTTDSQEAEAMAYLPALIQVRSNSWGPNDDGVTLEGPGSLTQAALKSAAETGRGGKGTLFLWAGGNGLDVADNSNYDGYANSIYTIAVGAFDSQSQQSWYSESGANLVVVAPSSGDALGITTVDRTGADGYDATSDYTTDFGGTSSATPTAAGIVALLLEANPNLGWRDVREILMKSAKKVNPTDTDWVTNAGGIHHSHKFGAGLIDATAAVALSTGWPNLSAQLKRTVAQTGLSVAIPNQNTTGVTRSFVIGAADNLRVEHVTVTVSITHTARGNLKITLTSPSGTTSRLAEVHSDSGDDYAPWTFMTVRNWGESVVGTWQLKIGDESATGNTVGGTLTAATLEVFGTATTPVNPPPTVVLTAPATNCVVSPGTTVPLAATVSDLTASGATGVVASVEFLDNGAVFHTDTTAPYGYVWSPTNGVHSVAARATDSEGASALTTAIRVEVVNRTPVIVSAQLAPSVDAYSDAPVYVANLVASDAENDPLSYTYQWQSSLNRTVWLDAPGLTTSALPAATNYAGRLWRCAVQASDGNSASAPFLTDSVTINNRPVTQGVVGTPYAYASALFVSSTTTSLRRQAILNEFSQGSNNGEWVELLTLRQGSLAAYGLQDSNSGTLRFQSGTVWSNIPAGTAIVVYNGGSTRDPLLPVDDANPNDDGRMVIASTNGTYFSAGTSWPALGNSGDGLRLLDATNGAVAQVGYGSNATFPPNVGAVGSSRSAYYAGGTEDGITNAANWYATSATTARTATRSLAPRAVGDLFFSEYVEGSGNNKAVEIYNPSAAAVDLSAAGYQVLNYANGSSSPSSIALSGTLQPAATFVIANSSASAALLALAQQTSGSLSFNGDDAMALRKGGSSGTLVDVIGQIGYDPGTAWVSNSVSTLDRTLRRKSAITQGDANGADVFDPSLEWDGYVVDAFDGLGAHAVDGGGGGGGVDPGLPTPEGVTPGSGNNPTNAAFVADLRAGVFSQPPAYRTGTGHQMPPGLTLDMATGRLAGTPTEAGTYTIVLERYNSQGETASQTYQLVIAATGAPDYAAWVGGFAGLSDTAPGADPDGDGTPNLLEYFMGFSPSETNGAGIVAAGVTGSVLRIEYRRSKTLSGVTGTVVWKSDLASPVAWSDVGVEDVWLSDHGAYELRRGSVPILGNEPQKFLRLRVRLP